METRLVAMIPCFTTLANSFGVLIVLPATMCIHPAKAAAMD